MYRIWLLYTNMERFQFLNHPDIFLTHVECNKAVYRYPDKFCTSRKWLPKTFLDIYKKFWKEYCTFSLTSINPFAMNVCLVKFQIESY